MQPLLTKLYEALSGVCPRVHHFVAIKPQVPYIVYAEDSDIDLVLNGSHVERGIQGTIDLYTKRDIDPLMENIPNALEEAGILYEFNSGQYEDETGLIHYEWVFEVI